MRDWLEMFRHEVRWYYHTMKWVLFNIPTHICTLSGEPCGKTLSECCEVCEKFDNQ